MISTSQRRVSLPLLALAAGAALLWGRPARRIEGRARRAEIEPRRAEGSLPQSDRGEAPAKPIVWMGSDGLLYRLYQEINNDRVLAVAGGVAFYMVLAIFPGIAAFISLYALFADPITIRDHLAVVQDFLPRDTFNLLQTEILRIAGASRGALGLASLISLVVALVSANGGAKALMDALNVAFGVPERRSFMRLNLTALAFTIGAIAFVLVGVAGVVVVPLLFAALGVAQAGASLLAFLRWPILLVILAVALSILYHFGPSRERARWRWLTAGSITAAILWIIASSVFSWYLANFADYNATYGSLGAAIGLLMWLWVTFVVVLAGAELDAELARRRGEADKPASSAKH
jgi:membrane protein